MGNVGSKGKRQRTALKRKARDLVVLESRAVADVAEVVVSSVFEIAEEVIARSGKVFVSGVGTSGTVARRMAHLLSVTGTPSVFLHPADAIHGSLGAIADGDVVFVISKGGESDEVNLFAKRAAERGAFVIALTHRPATDLTASAHRIVVFPDPGGADLAGIIAMGSTLAVSAWGDVLALVLKELKNYEWKDVLNSHPGGAVGKSGSLPSEQTIA